VRGVKFTVNVQSRLQHLGSVCADACERAGHALIARRPREDNSKRLWGGAGQGCGTELWLGVLAVRWKPQNQTKSRWRQPAKRAADNPRVVQLDAIFKLHSSTQSIHESQPGAIFKLHSSMQSIHGSYSTVQSSSCTARCNPSTGRTARCNLQVAQLDAILVRVDV